MVLEKAMVCLVQELDDTGMFGMFSGLGLGNTGG